MPDSRAVQDALRHFQVEKCNCAESVLWALAESMGQRTEQIPRIATAFGGGMAGQGEVCGALVGAAMAIGLRYGRDRGDDVASKTSTYSKVRELYEAFRTEFGSIRCLDLLGFSLLTPEGIARANEIDLYHNTCPAFVRFAAATAEGLIEA